MEDKSVILRRFTREEKDMLVKMMNESCEAVNDCKYCQALVPGYGCLHAILNEMEVLKK